MKVKFFLLLVAGGFLCQKLEAQAGPNISWWNPAQSTFKVIEGQAWPDSVQDRYDRLPASAQKNVRTAVWNLSKQSAGLLIRFWSNATNIKVRYKVGLRLAMPHMPSTGVSGVDLYAKNSDGEWLWCRGNYSFGDTVKYDFKDINLKEEHHDLGREYRLYLPLYNSVEWLEIGIPENARFDALPLRPEKPIVVYGTSIAQGACASRPGMAWTNILERKLDNPVINLAFSGNGMLEKELMDRIAEIDAKTYILDCLPNLVRLPLEDVRQRILASVRSLRKNRPSVPILLVDHAGYSDGSTNMERHDAYAGLNKVNHEAFAQLKSEGVTNIHLLTKDEIGLGLDSFVDGTHPSDFGMVHYAEAYEKSLRQILNEPIGTSPTTIPVSQAREPGHYNWEQRHRELLEMNKTDPPKICFFGNSIIHYWGGSPKTSIVHGGDTWEKYFKGLGVRNFSFGWDRVENALWRVYHGELDGFGAKQILVMLGTNNLGLNSDQEIIDGLRLLVQAMQARQPNADILLMGLLPRRQMEERVFGLNLQIAQLAGTLNVGYADLGRNLLNPDGKIDEKLFSDGLHPNVDGYNKIGPALKPYLAH